MKTALLSILTLIFAFEVSAQRRPAPGNGNGGRVVNRPPASRVVNRPPASRVSRRPSPGRVNNRPGTVVVRPHVRRPRAVVRVVPPYVWNHYSTRHLRPIRRTPIVWSRPFGYTCTAYGQLAINGQFIHHFRFAGECQQAIQDIRLYGDFCDDAELFDRSGIHEASFSYHYECREALGYYY